VRVLVTGATGFVGLNLLHSMVKGKHDPVALVRAGSPTDRLPEGVETREGNILDPDGLRDAVGDADAVVHLAATVYPDRDMTRTNVEGTENLLAAAEKEGIERVVFTSTIGAHPAMETDPDSTYQTSKARAEELLFGSEHSFDCSVLYPTYILGPYDYRLTRYEHFQPVASNRVLVPPLYTYDEFNVVHVADVVGTIEHALSASEPEQRYPVTGENIGHLAFLRTVAASLTGSCRVVNVPYPLLRYVGAPLIDALHRRGVSPVGSEGFLERGDYGTVPEELAGEAPVERRSWQAAVADTAAWYRKVGLL